jgi:hypothetical protein
VQVKIKPCVEYIPAMSLISWSHSHGSETVLSYVCIVQCEKCNIVKRVPIKTPVLTTVRSHQSYSLQRLFWINTVAYWGDWKAISHLKIFYFECMLPRIKGPLHNQNLSSIWKRQNKNYCTTVPFKTFLVPKKYRLCRAFSFWFTSNSFFTFI